MIKSEVPAKAVVSLPAADEPQLAQVLASAFSSLSSGSAAAVFARAAVLTLHRDETASAATVGGDVPGPPGDELSTSIQMLQRLVDQVGVKRFDQRMEASMAKSIEAIFSGTQWMTAAELGRAARPKAANPHSVTSRWRIGKRIYGVEWRGQLLFARYQLDAGFEPLPVMARILGAMVKSAPIEIASWFESPNSFLDGRRPRELLASEPDLVHEAAEDSLVTPLHG